MDPLMEHQMVNGYIYIVLISKVLYKVFAAHSLIHPFTHAHSHWWQWATIQHDHQEVSGVYCLVLGHLDRRTVIEAPPVWSVDDPLLSQPPQIFLNWMCSSWHNEHSKHGSVDFLLILKFSKSLSTGMSTTFIWDQGLDQLWTYEVNVQFLTDMLLYTRSHLKYCMFLCHAVCSIGCKAEAPAVVICDRDDGQHYENQTQIVKKSFKVLQNLRKRVWLW